METQTRLQQAFEKTLVEADQMYMGSGSDQMDMGLAEAADQVDMFFSQRQQTRWTWA